MIWQQGEGISSKTKVSLGHRLMYQQIATFLCSCHWYDGFPKASISNVYFDDKLTIQPLNSIPPFLAQVALGLLGLFWCFAALWVEIRCEIPETYNKRCWMLTLVQRWCLFGESRADKSWVEGIGIYINLSSFKMFLLFLFFLFQEKICPSLA